ncbi:hypothetical protein [Agarivorans litoreus]|uniref:hypothetical protein n=1 Tax=Agarivorans litoreus TaxID=1510455 RepID=UPI001C7E0165|nr:hypothetical protein [Agarivorans litoreus]
MSGSKIIFLIVLYKQKCHESQSLRTIVKQSNGEKIYVWDNSPEFDCDFSNFKENLSPDIDIEYHHNPQNTPLATVYEKILKYAYQRGFSHVCFMDQDSVFSQTFVGTLYSCITKSSDKVIVPRVNAHNEMVSPACNWKWLGWKCSYEPKKISKCFFSAINSGVCVPVPLFIKLNFSYLKGLRNYGTDVYMFEFIKQKKIDIVVSDEVIQHDLTFHKNNFNSEKVISAYIEHMVAMEIIFSSGLMKPMFWLYRAAHGLKVALIRQNLKFALWWL